MTQTLTIGGQSFTVTPGKYCPDALWLSSPSGSRLDWMDIKGMSQRQIRAALRNVKNFYVSQHRCECGRPYTSWRSYVRHRNSKHGGSLAKGSASHRMDTHR